MWGLPNAEALAYSALAKLLMGVVLPVVKQGWLSFPKTFMLAAEPGEQIREE